MYDIVMANMLALMADNPKRGKPDDSIEYLPFPNLIQEMLDYNPPHEKPYGKDWNYELEKARKEIHRNIDEAFRLERWMSYFKECGVAVIYQPPKTKDGLYIIGFDPYQ